VREAIDKLFGQAGCDGQLCVQALDGSDEIAVHADRQAVAASVFKVAVALEAETQFADGRLSPHERIILPAASRTPGPTGFSLFCDDAETSLRDLVTAMLTISDNTAADVLLHRVGIDTVNASSARLGLADTAITADLRTIINSIGCDAGFTDWTALLAWGSQPHSDKEHDQVAARILTATALTPALTTHTTPRDMATLLELIWSDQAGPPPACQRIRQLMSQQLTKHRLAAAFPAPAHVAAKSGSLVGVMRNEIGVITCPDGRRYAAAVFTRARQPWKGEAAINAVIGTAAAAAIEALSH
jgi:beta-lactamase class A